MLFPGDTKPEETFKFPPMVPVPERMPPATVMLPPKEPFKANCPSFTVKGSVNEALFPVKVQVPFPVFVMETEPPVLLNVPEKVVEESLQPVTKAELANERELVESPAREPRVTLALQVKFEEEERDTFAEFVSGLLNNTKLLLEALIVAFAAVDVSEKET